MVIHVKIAKANWTKIKALRLKTSYKDLLSSINQKLFYSCKERKIDQFTRKLCRIKNHTYTNTWFMTRAEFHGSRQRTGFSISAAETIENLYEKSSKTNHKRAGIFMAFGYTNIY